MSGSRTAVQWLAVACQPQIVRRSLKVSLLVGSVLALINHGDAILAGELTAIAAVKILFTYLVPYMVATWSAVQTTLASNAGNP